MTNDIIRAVRSEQPPLEAILTPKQLLYYRSYFRDGKTMAAIAVENDVDITTVCRVIKSARHRLLSYYERGAYNGNKANERTG